MNTQIKAGDIVYAPTVQKISCSKKDLKPALRLKFGTPRGDLYMSVLLGVLRKGALMPTPDQMQQLMGSIGWVSFDDVEELLGETAMKELMKHVENKYSDKKLSKEK